MGITQKGTLTRREFRVLSGFSSVLQHSRGNVTVTNGDSVSQGSHSVTWLIDRLRDEDPQAAEQIWRRYFERLLPLARSRITGLARQAVDAEDVLVSVFDRFFRAAKEDRFARLHDRDDLWQILLILTERKVADH